MVKVIVHTKGIERQKIKVIIFDGDLELETRDLNKLMILRQVE